MRVLILTMAFDYIFDTGNLLKRIDVLRIISQELFLLVQHFDESVARTRFKLPGIYFTSKFVKRPGILTKVIDIEHSLEINRNSELDVVRQLVF